MDRLDERNFTKLNQSQILAKLESMSVGERLWLYRPYVPEVDNLFSNRVKVEKDSYRIYVYLDGKFFSSYESETTVALVLSLSNFIFEERV